ncbi:MAG: hypothetical protein ACI9HI_002444 [Salinirussus sp.]|jgi:hypothetical protein
MGVDGVGDILDGVAPAHPDDHLVDHGRGLVAEQVTAKHLAVRGREHRRREGGAAFVVAGDERGETQRGGVMLCRRCPKPPPEA